MLLLRSMRRALYRPVNDGHYGLGLAAYAHFTSPIRRYPDLVVHRMLRAALTKRPQKFDQEVAALPWIAEHSSDMERVADTAARESQELKMVEYLRAFTGQAFSAVVSGVANCPGHRNPGTRPYICGHSRRASRGGGIRCGDS